MPASSSSPIDERHAARRLELVHVGEAVGVDAGKQRGHARHVGEVVPGEPDAGGRRHRHQVQRVVGRAAGRHQPDDAVDEGALVEHAADRGVGVACCGDGERALGGGPGQRVAQGRVRVDEGGTRQVQAHHLHQHLVGVGGAVEGAGAGRVIGGGLGLQQLLAADLALGVELADAALLRVGQARGHRPRGDQDGRQMAEGECADDQARHDLVADARAAGRRRTCRG